jgi:hypothetical protein
MKSGNVASVHEFPDTFPERELAAFDITFSSEIETDVLDEE